MDKASLENSFIYHVPTFEQIPKYERLRAKGKELAQMIYEDVPQSAEQVLAIRKVEEAIMWANKGIACNS